MRSWQPFRFKSIHTSIAIAFSCLILAMTALLTYNSYRLSEEAVTDNAETYTEQLIDQVNANVQTYLDNMVSISSLVMSNSELEKAAALRDLHSPEAFVLEEGIGKFFRSVVRSREDIATILFAGANGNVLSDREQPEYKPVDDLTRQDWYRNAVEAQGKVVISSSHVQYLYLREYRWVVSISRQLGEPGKPGSGVLMVDLNLNVINNLCKQIELGNRGYVFILDPAGDLIYHPQQQLLYSRLKSEAIPTLLATKDSSIPIQENGDRKIYTIRTNEFGWKVIGVTYPDELVGNKREIRTTSVLAGILFLIVALSISIFLSFRLTKPIKRLESLMKKVEKGDFNTRVEVESTDEIGKLSRSFNLMIGKIKDLMGQIVEEQEMKRISELKAMQAQIHPHFLYNTLDSIIWMAEMGKMEEVVKMTSALAKLFRSSISKGDGLVPIEVELEHIRNYLTIQNIRYKNKFTYVIDVDPSLYDCKTLKIVLQPLVENAIYHGLKQQAVIGHLSITGRRENGTIVLQVIDDGVGMSEEQVHALTDRLRQSEGGKGVGLQNVNHRIGLYFGDCYGLEIRSEPEEGTSVTLRIPEIR
ncbi:cache domain-containing sensor histidine kinase [Cohnella luojiensis]|uniref:histidine kinase n=1 Tax=Cohnella luojiensis TaxID=652876 RepID=A0A4Y8M9L5_9BACL|nr:sensor histidine kinase [Cohnella luojiensis]TFE30647.1 sensor histidine kinase [Cohnella luojiensis]